MNFRSFAASALVLMLAFGFAATRAEAQVLIYKLENIKNAGINYNTFEGGFFAAPLLGGTGSFLLTSTEGGRTFTSSDSSGRLFTAVDGKQKKAVISATTGSGTAHGALMALGEIDFLLNVHSPTIMLNVRVARTLTGAGVSADDESTATAPAVDGSIGSAGVSQLRFVLDEAETKYANNHGLSLSQAVERLKLELKRQGYTDSTSSTTTTTTTTGTTTATSTSGTASGQ